VIHDGATCVVDVAKVGAARLGRMETAPEHVHIEAGNIDTPTSIDAYTVATDVADKLSVDVDGVTTA